MSLEVELHKKLSGFTLSVAFSVKEGEIFSLFGSSGCGKSMTLKMIAGIETPDSGKVVLNGRILTDTAAKICLPPQKRRVGYLFQNYALFPHMTVAENIASGLPKGERHRRREIVQEKIHTFHLSGLEKEKPAALSGGQQQRVALARIFASSPEALLLDEPFSALDTGLRWEMELEMRKNLDRFLGESIFVSHNREEVYRLCDRIGVMEAGRMQKPETPQTLFKQPGSLAALRLSGCKNDSTASLDQKKPGYLLANDWLLSLKGVENPPKGLCGCGIRAHHLQEGKEGEENTFSMKVEDCIEDVFEWLFLLRPAPGAAKLLYWSIPKNKREAAAPPYQIGQNLLVTLPLKSLILLTR